MLKNYLITALRNIWRNKAISLINLAGLAIGLACSIIIVVYARHELSYDTFHKNSNRIYRVLTIDKALGVTNNHVAITTPAIASAMEAEIPEVTESCKMNYSGRNLIQYEEQTLYTEHTLLAEPEFFKLFDIPIIQGDQENALKRPNTGLMTREMARKVFGEEDPVGKTFQLDKNRDIEITGIVGVPSEPSHLELDLLISIYPTEQDTNWAQWLESWQSISMSGYVMLESPDDELVVEEKMEELVRKHDVSKNFEFTLQPLEDIHLKSSSILYDDINQEKGDASQVFSMLLVAAFLILIACFNFMNLSTAKSTNRAKEVGLRKVSGATRWQLLVQFTSEAILLCVIAVVLSLGLVEIVGSFIELPVEGSLLLLLFTDPLLVFFLILLTVLTGVVAGSYPAILLSRYQPVKVLKGIFKNGSEGILLRKVLVITQFTASIVMIIGMVLVFEQLSYLKNKKLGFQKDQVLYFMLNDQELFKNKEALMNELSAIPNVQQVASSSNMPGNTFSRNKIQPEGTTEEDIWIVSVMSVDENYIPLMEMEVAQGRNFSKDKATDQQETMIINKAMANALGWEDAVGKTIKHNGQDVKVIGVLEDFHFAYMRHQIEPIVIRYNPNWNGVVTLKSEPENIDATIASMESVWKNVNPNHPFEFRFFDEQFEQLYRSDERFAGLLLQFTWLAILIACLGLFGLAAYTTEQRTKEIGIRKVIGASVQQIFLLLSKDFVKLVLIASILAWPIAWFAMNDWLQEFAYRIDIGWAIFITASIAACVIALISVSSQSIKAAVRNPVDALKYE